MWWFLFLLALLSLLTSLSWFVSLIMPDILGSVLYLCIYLLVFVGETLMRLERLAVALPRLWRRLPPRLTSLGVVIVFTVIANAFLTGAMSMVEDRYQGRVIWLLPLLACLLLLD